MSRTIDGNSQRAYRVIIKAVSWENIKGPYSTLAAAKGVRTRESLYWPQAEIYIEQTQEGWERVELGQD